MLYPSAKVIIKDSNRPDSILLIERNVYGNLSVEPAGGGVEVNFTKRSAETLEQCAVREIREELGYVIDIFQYLGSYYFFWTIDPAKCSICAVFVGFIADTDSAFMANADVCEVPIRPVWVTRDDIMDGKVKVSPCHNGLREILLKSFGKI